MEMKQREQAPILLFLAEPFLLPLPPSVIHGLMFLSSCCNEKCFFGTRNICLPVGLKPLLFLWEFPTLVSETVEASNVIGWGKL